MLVQPVWSGVGSLLWCSFSASQWQWQNFVRLCRQGDPFQAELKMNKMLIYLWTSGGLYYAAAVLAPPGYGPFAAWMTGWSNWIGQIASAPSVDYALAAMILAAVSINDPNYVPAKHQTFLLTTLILIVHTAISSMPTRWIAKFNSYGSTFNILALVITIIAIPAGTLNVPKFNPSSQVWGDVYNGTDFSDGVDRKSTRLNSSHLARSRMPSSA